MFQGTKGITLLQPSLRGQSERQQGFFTRPPAQGFFTTAARRSRTTAGFPTPCSRPGNGSFRGSAAWTWSWRDEGTRHGRCRHSGLELEDSLAPSLTPLRAAVKPAASSSSSSPVNVNPSLCSPNRRPPRYRKQKTGEPRPRTQLLTAPYAWRGAAPAAGSRSCAAGTSSTPPACSAGCGPAPTVPTAGPPCELAPNSRKEGWMDGKCGTG